ncbi:MAG: hypothetical protein J6W00_12355, partial [Lentisphaeria bacterium]|nr:hypothetical protein [Lentisphaeria bacterium]
MATLYVGSSQTFKTIADAVKAANSGDTIIVYGSEYTATDERVRVDKSLTLRADGDVTLRGMNIGGSNFDVVIDGFNFVADAADAASSSITGYNDNASCITQVDSLRNVTITNCSFDLTNVGYKPTAYGIYLTIGKWGFENLTVTNNTCNGILEYDGYELQDFSGYGLIYAANVNNADISNNTVSGGAGHAIQLSVQGVESSNFEGEQKIAINGNQIDNFYGDAIYIADTRSPLLEFEICNNVLSNLTLGQCGNGGGAIMIYPNGKPIGGAVITDNIIDGAQIGINMHNAVVSEKSDGVIDVSGNMISAREMNPENTGTVTGIARLDDADLATKNVITDQPLANADLSTATIYVNSSWESFSAGTKVTANGKILQVGTNAFADIGDAFEAVGDNGTVMLFNGANLDIAKWGYVDGKEIYLKGNGVIAADDKNTPAWIRVGKNAAGSLTIESGSDIEIKNQIASGVNVSGISANSASGGVLNIGENAKLTINKLVLKGKAEINGTLDALRIDMTNEENYKTPATLNVNKDGKLIVSRDNINEVGQIAPINIGENTMLNVNGGHVEADAVDNKGTLTVNGGTVDVDTLKNNGIFKVTGSDASTVKAAITGKALQLENGVLEDSEIGGTVNVYGTNNTIKGTADNPTTTRNVQIGFGNYTAANAALNILGKVTTDIVYVGLKPGEANDAYQYKLNIGSAGEVVARDEENRKTADVSISTLNIRPTGKAAIDNATITLRDDLLVRGELVINNSSVTGNETYHYVAISEDDFENTPRVQMNGSDFILNGGNTHFHLGSQGGDSATGNAELVLNDSKITAYNFAVAGGGDWDVSLTLTDNSVINGFGLMNIAAGADVSLTGSRLEAGSWNEEKTEFTGIELKMNGAISMDAKSLITAGSITGAGTITVNAKGWSGIAKVVDLTTGENAVDVVITGNSNAYQVTDGNDTYVTTADKSSFLLTADVNGDGEADKFGDVSADGKFIAGVNAFDSAADAINAMSAATKTIYVDGEINGTWPGQVWEGTEAFKYALNFQKAEGAASAVINAYADAQNYSYRFAHDLTVGKDVTLKLYDDVDNNVHYDNQIDFAPAGAKVTVTVDGTLIYSTANFGAGAKDESGMYIADMSKTVYINVTETGKMFATGEGNVTFFENSVLTVKGTGKENLQFTTGSYTQFGGKVDLQDTCIRIWGTTSATLSENVWMGLGNYTFAGDGVFTAANSRIEVVDGILTYEHAKEAPASNAGLPETKFEDLNRNVVYFDKTSNLTNTDIYAGDMYVMGKTVTMNGGILDLAADVGQTQNGPNPLETSGDLTIAKDATLAMTNAALDAEGTVTNKGTLSVNGGTFTADTFKQNSSEQAIFNNLNFTAGTIVNGIDSSDAFTVFGGTSVIKVGSVTGENGLRFAAGAVLADGTNIGGNYSNRALGSLTIGEKATDKIHLNYFDTKYAIIDKITVNGIWDIAAQGTGSLSINGNSDGKTITLGGAGNVTANGCVYFQGCLDANNKYIAYGNIAVDKDITVTLNDGNWESHLRFTYTDVTVKGSIINANDGGNLGYTALCSANVTLTGSQARLDLASDLKIGYDYIYDNKPAEPGKWASTLSVEAGANVEVDTKVLVNQGSKINVNNATFIAGTMNNNGEFNVSGKSTIDIDQINGGVRMNGFTGSFDANVKGYVLTYGKSEFSNDFDTQDLYVGKKIENGAKANTDILTVKSGVTLDTAVIYVRGTGVMNIEAGATVNTSMHFNGSASGGFYSYGTTNISGSLTINGGDGMLIGSSSYANENGVAVINVNQGGTLSVSDVTMKIDSDAALNITSGTFTAGSVTNNGTITIKGNSTINATITGNVAKVAKGAVITVVDNAFTAGVDSYTMKLDVYNLANLKSINGVDVAGNATAGYSVKIGEVLYSIADANAGGLVFTALKDDEDNISDNVEIGGYTGSLDGLTSDYVVEAKAGTATLKVNKGESATVAAITKDENGGVTNLNLNGNLTVGTTDDHGSIEAVGKITTGSDVEVKMGDVSGTNLNSTISLGKNNAAFFDNIDMKGGSNTLSIGANSEVMVDDNDSDGGTIENVKTINLASGTYKKATKTAPESIEYTTLTVTGDITAPAMSNSITLGNYAKLDVAGDLDNGDVNVGTTIKAGNYSEVLFGKPDGNGGVTGGEVTSLAGLSIGTGSTFKAAVVGGTAGNNIISFGNNSVAKVMEGINLRLGNDTIKTGTGAKIEVGGDISNVENISLGNYAKLFVDGNLLNDGNNAGTTIKAGNYSEVVFGKPENGVVNGGEVTSLAGLTLGTEGVFKAASVSGTEKNNTVSLGKGADMFVVGGIDLCGGNDTIKLGNEAELTAASITGVETITLGAKAYLDVAGNITGVSRLTVGNGTYTKKTDVTDWTEVTAGNVTGTDKNDTVSFGNYNDIELASLNLGAGNDTLKVGNDSIVDLGAVDLGAGSNTLTVGSKGTFTSGDITGVNKLTAGNGTAATKTAAAVYTGFTAEAITG